MPPFDYSSCKPEDLEMVREPRKSVIRIKHKASGVVADEPVIPGSHSPARFRRASNLPKENRLPGMEGYIEGQSDDDKSLFPIIEGDNPSNEYLTKLAADPAALEASFEGVKQQAKKPEAAPKPVEASKPTETSDTPDVGAEQPAAESATEEPAVEEPPPPPQPTAEPADADELGDLDDMLAQLES